MNTSYRIDLRTFGNGIVQKELILTDDFFESLEQSEIHGGEVVVDLNAKRISEFLFEMTFQMRGQVVVTCDRCLDLLSLPVDLNDRVRVQLGRCDNVNADVVCVAENVGVYDFGWRLYESILLSLPLERKHEENKCNAEMLNLLKNYSTSLQEDKSNN